MEVEDITQMTISDFLDYFEAQGIDAAFHEFSFEYDGHFVKMVMGRDDGALLIDAVLEAFFGAEAADE